MKIMKILHAFLIIFLIHATQAQDPDNEDFYKRLGVQRDATVKEIRKAFKNIALTMHPDKNKDDKQADEKFIKLVQAYEILKDPETRKGYDLHGYTGLEGTRPEYHSYTYYSNEFGLYDDDPIIVTLSKADYELNVLDNNQGWFINFYSPQCHHCHTLAPIWRKLAVQLDGVVRIAAVNCADDWRLCRQLSIEAYPTLLYYEKEAHLYEGEQYRGEKSMEALQDYILSKLTVSINKISLENWDEDFLRKEKQLLFLCPDSGESCPERTTQLKLAAALEGLMPVRMVEDYGLVEKVYKSYKEGPIILWLVDETDVENAGIAHNVMGSDMKEIMDKILNILPNPPTLNEDDFQNYRSELRSDLDKKPMLLCFFLGTATELNLKLKRLPTLISNINIGLVHCGRSAALCSALHVSHYPTWGVLKSGGAFEIHHGRDILNDVAAFARDSTKAINLHALSPADFKNLKSTGSAWFIDWYAPWCPPCRRLMPEIRRASQHFDPEVVQFGTIDCALHSQLCTSEGIRSYPTAILYNNSKSYHFHGVPDEEGLARFVDDVLHPVVLTLDKDTFVQLKRKPDNEIWIVDFFAPWCGPCQRLASEWNLLAKELQNFNNIKVVQVDCVASGEICESQRINSYPTIRLYPMGSKGLNTVAMYNGHRDATSLKQWVLSFLPTPVVALNGVEFRKQILTKKYYLPWLVDFYAPWCAHCVNFEPDFSTVARKLESKVRSAKVDCEKERVLCRELRITSYPTVMFYLSPKKYFEIDSQYPNEILQIVKKYMELKSSYSHDEL